MAECDECGGETNMPYECKRCGGSFCVEHRLPEGHNCPALESWSPPGGNAGGGSSGGALGGEPHGGSGGGIGSSAGRSGGILDKLPIDTGRGGVGGYFRNNMTFVFLIAIWLVYAVQLLLRVTGHGSAPIGSGLEDYLFSLESHRIEHVWTWVTSVFAHGSFLHIVFNSMVLYFFGPVLERKIGSKRFATFYLVAGILSGLTQALLLSHLGIARGAVGASGAILGIMGVLTILNPELRVMLLIPPIPMPLWVMTGGLAVLSTVLILAGVPLAGGIGHTAHLVGVVLGFAYGKKLEREGVTAPRQMQMGGGPGGGLGGGRRRF